MTNLNTADKIIKTSNLDLLTTSIEEYNDYENETTTFIFEDNSVIVDNNGSLKAYFDIKAVDAVYNSERSEEEYAYMIDSIYA